MIVKILALLFLLLPQDLDDDEFRKLHREIQPENPTWKTIPWHADLKSAQRVAAEKRKLLFIWAMDGHPLGCT